jgi:hypothetical protein
MDTRCTPKTREFYRTTGHKPAREVIRENS